MTKNLLLLTCATGALSLAAGVSHAATATAAATDQATTNVTELVVTAEKRETSLQRVPVAVSVFTGAQRDAIGINTVADVTNFAPGFSYDPATVHAYIRGVGRQSVNVTDDQRVANYEDEFYVYSPYGLDKSSLFLSQEQIERGPQNVGGRQAAAGSIDMISVRPTDHPYAEIRATVANYGVYNIEGAASGQVAPGLDVRIAGYDKNQNVGFFRNLSGGKSEGSVAHEYYLEGQVDYKPNDQWEFWARGYVSGWNNRGDAGSRVGYLGGSFDETNLTDGNAYVGGGLFVNPNFGYAAPNGNPSANAGLILAKAHGLSGDPVPLSAVLINGSVLDNPALTAHANFISPIERDVKLNGYDDFNYILTYHAPGFDIKYNGGIQGYNYYLTYDGTDTGIRQFTLPGNQGLAGVSNAINFPGCPSVAIPFACGFGGTAVKAATPLATGNLVINPMVRSNYVEDDWWTAHDLTFQSTTDSPLQWTAGGFFYYQHYNQPYDVSDPQQPQLGTPSYTPPSVNVLASPLCASVANPTGFCGLNVAPGIPAPANPHRDILYVDYKFNVESIAGYGQVSYKINDQWRVTGDLRYSWDEKWGVENARYLFMGSGIIDPLVGILGPNTPALDITPSQTCLTGNSASCNSGALAKGVKSIGVILPNGYAQRQLSITSSAFTGGAGIEFTPTPDIFTYFRYGRGYEPPSFNAGQVIANPEVGPEFLNSYEIGYKQSFGRSLLVDLAAFYYDYEGFQLPISIANGGVTQAQFVNVPKAKSEGIEAEVYWSPVRDLTITGSYSYDNTAVLTGCNGSINALGQFVQATGALCLIDTNDPNAVFPGARPFPGQNPAAARNQSVKGDPLPDAPQNKVAVAVAYTWHYDPGDLTLSSAYVWRDKMTGDVFNRPYSSSPAWSDVDIRALWKGPHDHYEVIAFVKNVFNTEQYTVAAGGVGLLGNSFRVTNAAAGLFHDNLYDLNPPRTYGVEVRYKFF